MATSALANEGEPQGRRGGVERPNYVPAGHDFRSITERVCAVLNSTLSPGWLGCFGFSQILLAIFAVAVIYLLVAGVGIWGIDIPVAWGFGITDFVWWIGIGHAGTLISAFLLLMHQKWRTSINRIAEAMTIFAVMCAGMFPLLHLGRPWFFYWLLPYPDTMGLWPQFRSALVWDVFAVSTYFTVSLLFWYMGMIPDLATLRDRAQSRVGQVIYGMLALGWRNSARHWHRFEMSYLLLGGLATPLVISVHSVVSSDFAVSVVPAWHETVFPPYFVAGAIFSGFAMVLVLCIPIRHLYGLKDFITLDHLDVMGKLVLATSLLTSYGYLSEQFLSLYAGETVERYVYTNRLLAFDQYAVITWILFTCNTLVPQILWIKPLRRKEGVLLVVSLLVLAGMWLERYMIITTSLHRDYLPSSWGMFFPTIWDIATYLGSIGVFLAAFLLFARFLPLLSMAETRALLPGAARDGGGKMKSRPTIFGLMVEFLTAQEILDATRRARQAGYREMDAYTPYPVEGLAVELGMRRTRIPFAVLMAGLVGAGLGFFMMVYSMAVNYRFNAGGRPYNSWPVFVPIAFEVMVLVGALAAFLAMLFLNGLPHPHHPVFNVPRFGRSSQDRFFLCIEATDPQFDHQATAAFLAGLGPHGEVIEVPHDRRPNAETEGQTVEARNEGQEL